MNIYIQSSESISPQKTFNINNILTDIIPLDKEYFLCLTPDFKEYLDVKLLRRMSKILKIGVTTAKKCVEKSNINMPDAIIVGTGLGCIEDTTKFLNQIIENDEQLLNPTPFINSTHNTISGQIALYLQCKNYNLTFTQNALSFETALIDGIMLLNDLDANNILIGGIDEITEESFELVNLSGCINQNFNEKLGEGGTFFIISNQKNENTNIEIVDIQILNYFTEFNEINIFISSFLNKNNLSIKDIDFVVNGMNGKNDLNPLYIDLNNLFSNSNIINYKHLVGEYNTAFSFGMYLANNILINNRIPESTIFNKVNNELNKGLVVNITKNYELSILLLSKC